jgi:DNA-binding GntR family transcriptional regulator
MKGLPDNRTIGLTVIWATPSLPYAPRMDLDPGSRWPLSAQLAQLLRSEIRSGRLVVGDLLPSEHELADEHGVSRETARRSLTMLADEGLITRRRGVGSIVAEAEPFEEVRPALGARISARLPTAAERDATHAGSWVPVLAVREPGSPERLYPADRIVIVIPDR